MSNEVKYTGSTTLAKNTALVKAELGKKLDKTGGTLTGDLTISGAWLNVKSTDTGDGNISVDGSLVAGRGVSVLNDDKYVSLVCTGDNAAKIAGSGNNCARLAVGTPTGDNDAATKKYVDGRAVRYDAAQGLTSDQKFVACTNIGAVNQKGAWMEGNVMLLPRGADGAFSINITPSENSNDYTLTLDAGPENVPVYVAGLETPTDAETDYAANVAYVKKKIAEVAASGGVDVDNALSATSTNPVQNKVVTAALTGKASTTVASASANGLMSKEDKDKLDHIAYGATQVTIDSAMSGSSNNPVANHVVKQYIDDKVAAAGGNITVDTALSDTSVNPVQNKAILSALNKKAAASDLALKADKANPNFTGSIRLQEESGEDFHVTAAVRPFDDKNISLNFEPESPNSSYAGVVIDCLATVEADINGWPQVAVNQEMMEKYVGKKVSGLQTASQVQDAIKSAVSGVYTPKGSIAFASLPTAAAGNKGWVYNVSDAFTTTAAFVEGAGHSYGAGTNVVCVDVGSGSYKWDVLAGTIDLTELTADEVQTLWNSI